MEYLSSLQMGCRDSQSSSGAMPVDRYTMLCKQAEGPVPARTLKYVHNSLDSHPM